MHDPRHSSRSRHRAARSLLGAAAAAALLVTGSAIAAADPPGGGTPPSDSSSGGAGAGSTHTVTLITGDVVTLTELADGTSTVAIDQVDPGAVIQTFTVDGDVHVVPESALTYLTSGALEPALFDVSTLVEYGFDDASVAGTPVIVEYGSRATARTAPVTGLDLDVPLASIGGAAGTADRAEAESTWQQLTATSRSRSAAGAFAGGIEAIHLDAPVHALLDTSVPYIGAPEAWAAGFDGSGVQVAVLDSGADVSHPDLADAVVETRSFVPDEDITDVNGHGTHVASTVAGSGAASDGAYTGVAPGADLLIGKVLNDDGEGLTSWIIEGMQWGAENADVVSMSLGSQESSDGTDVMSQALDTISAETGTLFVVAAGNSSMPETIGAPAAAASALAVASVDDRTDELSWFSSQGPLAGSGALKPDVAAPGSDITAARSSASAGEGSYTTMSGTSMATPHVSGAAAIALQADPDLTGAQLKDLLISSARDLGFTPYQAGSGVVDVASLVSRDVFATGVADFGMLAWGEDPGPVEREVAFTNRSDAEVTIDLALSTALQEDDGGGGIVPGSVTLAAVEDAVTLSQEQVSVPAQGSASVTLTGDYTALDAGDQLYGSLVGTVDGEPVTRTSIGMITENERYDLTIRATGPDGTPLATTAMLFDLDRMSAEMVGVDGETTLRRPGGRYSVMAFADVPTADGGTAIALVGEPLVEVRSDVDVELDVREAVPVVADVGRDDLEAENRRMDFRIGGMSGSAMVPLLVDELWAQPTVVDGEEFAFTTRWRLRDERLQVTLDGQQLPVVLQAAAPYLDGELTASATDLGTGSAADVAGVDLAGGIAVVTASDAVPPAERAINAAAAGAALLLVVQPTEAIEWYGTDEGEDAPIPVAGLSGAAGATLAAAVADGPVTVGALGRPAAEDLYDLVLFSDGEIPENPTKTGDDLALVTTTYHGTQGSLVGEFRYDFVPGVDVGQGFMFATERPSVRREWVSTTDVEWYQDAMDVASTWEVRDTRRSYLAGEELEASYFGPVVRPYVGGGYWAPFRQADTVQLNIPAWADGGGPDRTGAMDTYAGVPGLVQQIELYVDGELVEQSDAQSLVTWDLPVTQTRWRVVNVSEQDGSALPTTSASRTVWEFDSVGRDEETVLPLMQAVYDVGDDVALDGTVGAEREPGEPVELGLEVGHLAGADGSAPVSAVTLEYSTDDGASWAAADLGEVGDGGGIAPMIAFVDEREHVRSFTTSLPVPDGGASVWLRVTATDEAGSTFSQELTGAFEAAAVEAVEPTEPPTEPTDPGTDPSDGGTDPSDGASDPSNGAGDPGGSAGPGSDDASSDDGSLPVTGASVGALLLLAGAAITAGLLLRRRAMAAASPAPGKPGNG